MRVLIASTNFYTGGINSFSLALGKSLRSQGIEIIFLATEPYGMLYNNFKDVFNEVKIIKRNFDSLDTYFKKLTDFINGCEIDLLINNGVECIQAIIPLLNRQTKIFSIIHSIEENELYIGCQNYKYLDLIICVSENIKTEALRFVPAQKLKVVPVGVELSEDYDLRISDKLNLIYVGRISRIAKNLDTLINIADELKQKKIDYNLLVIGDGEYIKKLKIDVKNRGLEKSVHFKGALYKEQIIENLHQSDIFLLTSEYEGTPNALLEAMVCGVVPVVSNITGSTDRIITNGVNGFLCEISNTNEFVQNILYLKNNAEDYRIIAENARKTVEENYNISKVTKIYLSFYQSVKESKNQSNNISVEKLLLDKKLKIFCRPFHLQVKRLLGDAYRNIFKGIKPIKR